MIPPFLLTKAASILAPVAGKLASPAVKWSLIAAAFVISNVCTAIYFWHHTSLQCEQSKTEAMAVQAQTLSTQTAQVVASREEVLKQRNDLDRQLTQRIVDLQKKVTLYERNAKKTTTPVPPDSIAMFNAIGGLLSDQNAMRGAAASSGKSDESPEARIETTQLLLAYVRAYTDSAEQLATLWQDYDALVRTIRKQYHIQKGDQL